MSVDWVSLFPAARIVDLPTYPFQHQRYWPKPAARPAPTGAGPVDDAFWRLVEDGGLATALDVTPDLAAAMAPALASWRDRQNTRSTVDAWRYRESWTPLNPPATTPAGTWLAVVPAGYADDAWTTAVLAAFGPDLVCVETGPDRAILAKKLAALPAREFSGVVSLAAVVAGGPGPVPAGLTQSLLVVQALGDAGITAPLWCVTREAVSTGPADPVTSPEQATLWGLGRVAALELPDRWGGLADLPADLDDETGRRFVTALRGAGDEDQLAVRAFGTFGRRLVRAPAPAVPAEPWQTSGTTLITGGTGGVGAHLARWAVAAGAEHVVLVSRRGPDAPGARDLRADLEGRGARVTVAACDVSDRDALSGVLSAIPADVPLRAVVHAAGVGTGDAPVEALTAGDLESFLRTKLVAARHLHELTAGAGLDAFVLFSSGAAVWGSGGQPGYAAGNAYLTALAQHRRAAGQVATSVAWGAWAEAGMAHDNAEAMANLRRYGLSPMSPRLAITALDQAVAEDVTQLAVTDTDWARFAPSFTARRPSPLLSGIPEVRDALESEAAAATGAGPDAPGGLAQRLAGMPEAERTRALLDVVRGAAAAILGYGSAEELPANRAFREVGFDSVTAVELRNRLRAATGLKLPAALVFDHPTPAAIARLLGVELFGDAPADADPDAEIRAALAAVPIARLRKAGLLDMVLRLADDGEPANGAAPEPGTNLDSLDGESLLRLVHGTTTDRPTT